MSEHYFSIRLFGLFLVLFVALGAATAFAITPTRTALILRMTLLAVRIESKTETLLA